MPCNSKNIKKIILDNYREVYESSLQFRTNQREQIIEFSKKHIDELEAGNNPLQVFQIFQNETEKLKADLQQFEEKKKSSTGSIERLIPKLKAPEIREVIEFVKEMNAKMLADMETEAEIPELEMFNRMLKEKLDLKSASNKNKEISFSYSGLYYFQHDFLPKKFYNYGKKLLKLFEEEGFEWLVNEYNKEASEKYTCNLNSSNALLETKKYPKNKAIVRLNIPDLHGVVSNNRINILCKSIYFCFDIDDENNNKCFTSEIDEINGKYLLCEKTQEGNRINYGYASDADIDFDIIEKYFISESNSDTEK